MSPPPRVIGQKTAQEAVERCATGRSKVTHVLLHRGHCPTAALALWASGGGLGTEPASVDRHAAASHRDGRGGVACRGGGGHRWVKNRRSIYAPMSSTGPISVLCPWPKGLQIAWRQRRRCLRRWSTSRHSSLCPCPSQPLMTVVISERAGVSVAGGIVQFIRTCTCWWW